MVFRQRSGNSTIAADWLWRMQIAFSTSRIGVSSVGIVVVMVVDEAK